MFPYAHYIPKGARENLDFPTDVLAFYANNSTNPKVMEVNQEGDQPSLKLIDQDKLELEQTEHEDP